MSNSAQTGIEFVAAGRFDNSGSGPTLAFVSSYGVIESSLTEIAVGTYEFDIDGEDVDLEFQSGSVNARDASGPLTCGILFQVNTPGRINVQLNFELPDGSGTAVLPTAGSFVVMRPPTLESQVS